MKSTIKAVRRSPGDIVAEWWNFHIFWLGKLNEIKAMTTANIPDGIQFWKA